MKLPFLFPAIFLLFQLSASAGFANRCIDTHLKTKKSSVDYTFDNLPAKNSPPYKQMVQAVRDQFRKSKSFALIDLSQVVPKEAGMDWYNSMPSENSGSTIYWHQPLKDRTEGSSYIWPHHRKIRWEQRGLLQSSPAHESQIQGAEKLTVWFHDLLFEAFDGAVKMTEGSTTVRLINSEGKSENSRDRSNEPWHRDGQSLAVILTIQGATTETREPGGESSVPSGHALIFFGYEGSEYGYEPLIHRSPPGAKERVLFVIRY